MTLKEERELKKAAKLEAEKQRIEAMREYEEMYDTFSVSYTHLTLPTT